MATATPQLYNSTDFTVIAELLYRRTGLTVAPAAVSYALAATPGVESVTNGYLGRGDGATLAFIPKLNNVVVASGLVITALRQTYQGVTTTLAPSVYSINPLNQAVTFTTAPPEQALLEGDFSGVPVPYLTITANPTLPDLSTGPFVGSVRLALERVDVGSLIPAVLVYSDAFPATADAIITYMATHYGLQMSDGEFVIPSDPTQTPLARGGGLIAATLDANRQFHLVATRSSIRWTPGSQLTVQQQTMQSIVPPGYFAFVGDPVDGSLGEPYNYTFQTVNGVAPVVYSVISGTPPAAVNPATGAMHADRLTTVAAYSWVMEATDASGHVTTKNCIMQVTITPLTMTPDTTTPAWTVGIPQALNFNPYGGQRPFTYAVTAGSMPTGLAIVGDGLYGSMEGNPSASNSVLQSTFTITATDNRGQTAIMNFNATVTDRTPTVAMQSLRTKLVNWWDLLHSTPGSSLAAGQLLYDGTNQMNLTVGGGALNALSTGRSGTAAGFTFGGAYAQASTTAYNLASNFTLLGLFNLPSTTAVLPGQVIFGRGGDSHGGFSLNIGPGGNTLALAVDVNGVPTTTNFTSTLPVGYGNWAMAMVERYNGVPSLILNGGSTESAVAATGSLTANTTQYLTLGADPVLDAASKFAGGVAMLAIFNDKLWSDERKWLWNGGNGHFFSDLNYWPPIQLTPNQALPTSLTLGVAVSLAFTLSGGTGIYHDIMDISAIDQLTPVPGLVLAFDGIKTVTLSGTPTDIGSYRNGIRAYSTDGQARDTPISLAVTNPVTTLTSLTMAGAASATAVTDPTGRHWTVHGTAAIATAVDPNGDMQFDGSTNCYLSTPFTHDMDLAGASWTLAIDLYPTSANNLNVINTSALASEYLSPIYLGAGPQGMQGPPGATATGLYPYLGWQQPATGGTSGLVSQVNGTLPLSQNAWNTVTGIYDAATLTLKLFLDGQFVGATTFPAGTTHPVINPNDALVVGSAGASGANAMMGYLRNFSWSTGMIYQTLALGSTAFGPYVPSTAGSSSAAILGGNGVYGASSTTLPAGLSVSVTTGNTLTIAGTTTAATGTYNCSVRLTSGDGQAVAVSITVTVALPPNTLTTNESAPLTTNEGAILVTA